MWNKATNNLKIPSELTVQPSSPTPLFTVTPAGAMKTASQEFVVFQGNLPVRGDPPPVKTKTATDFLSEICKPGGPVEEALNYLKAIGILPATTNLASFQNKLHDIWFTPYYKKKTKLWHNGFEHTFVGDKVLSIKDYKGFHNWYQFLIEQASGGITNVPTSFSKPIQFLVATKPPYMSCLTFKWGIATKASRQGSSLFVGTSPAFEIALFSACFLQYPGDQCSCTIGTSSVTVQTYTSPPSVPPVTAVATAYPSEVSNLAGGRCDGIAKQYRTDCGWIGISKNECNDRCCCWKEEPGTYDTPWPWCFYPEGHRCQGIAQDDRKECGYLGIQRDECERKNCCFDSHVPGVTFCFKGRY
ncbi:unnamed protein product [Porites evermanni]|uniref:Uridylate-specific endoribonuclease n=1 Tax=Porites evermanni TaxID=104178 RepID=A0ABN8SNG8_9CNID|nr:unnamed protein product [Porites evermanni]